MNPSFQSTASSGHQSSWSEATMKKIKVRRQKVYDIIKDRDQFTNLAMEMVLDNTSFQRVFQVLFEGEQMTLFAKSLVNFWELGLKTQNIINYNFESWDINPPRKLDDLQELSDFPLCSQRALIADKPLKVSLPFVPKFIHYKEVCRLYILDNTEAWYTGESLVLNKVPMSDVFTFKQCFIIKDLGNSKVLVQFKWFVDFHKWTPFKGTVNSSTKDEIEFYNTKFFKPALEEALKTGAFIPLKGESFQPKTLAKDNLSLLQEEIKIEDKLAMEDSIKEPIKEIPVKSTAEELKVMDPLDEPINQLLKEMRVRDQGSETSGNVLNRFFRPKYKGDFLFLAIDGHFFNKSGCCLILLR